MITVTLMAGSYNYSRVLSGPEEAWMIEKAMRQFAEADDPRGRIEIRRNEPKPIVIEAIAA